MSSRGSPLSSFRSRLLSSKPIPPSSRAHGDGGSQLFSFQGGGLFRPSGGSGGFATDVADGEDGVIVSPTTDEGAPIYIDFGVSKANESAKQGVGSIFEDLVSDTQDDNSSVTRIAGKMSDRGSFVLPKRQKTSIVEFLLSPDEQNLCGGTIGSSGRLCISRREVCLVKQHKRTCHPVLADARARGTKSLLLVKVPTVEAQAFTEPALDPIKLTRAQVQDLIERAPSSVDVLFNLFGTLNSSLADPKDGAQKHVNWQLHHGSDSKSDSSLLEVVLPLRKDVQLLQGNLGQHNRRLEEQEANLAAVNARLDRVLTRVEELERAKFHLERENTRLKARCSALEDHQVQPEEFTDLSDLLSRVEQLEARQSETAVKLAGHTFRSLADTTAFCVEHNVGSDVFLLCLNFLSLLEVATSVSRSFAENVKTEHSGQRTGFSRRMDQQVKFGFQLQAPTCLAGTPGAKKARSFGRVKNLSDFEGSSGTGVGVRDSTLNELAVAVATAKREIATSTMSPKAKTLGNGMVDSSSMFISRMFAMMTTMVLLFQRDASRSQARAWELTQAILRHLMRIIAAPLKRVSQLSVAQVSERAGEILWANLQAYRLQQEVSDADFHRHPEATNLLVSYLMESAAFKDERNPRGFRG